MPLTEEQKQKIEEEERHRAKVRAELQKKPWWQPRGCLGWLVAIFIVFPIAMYLAVTLYPLAFIGLLGYILWKLRVKIPPKVAKIVILSFIGLMALTIVLAVLVPMEKGDSAQSEPESSLFTPLTSPTAAPTLIPTPTPEETDCTLPAKVKYDMSQLEVTNLGTTDWHEVVIRINSGLLSGGFEYKAPYPLKAGRYIQWD